MRTRARVACLLAVPCLLGAAACGRSPAPRFYTLAPSATADAGPPLAVAVVVGPVSIPPDVDRPQLVLQETPNRLAVQEFDRWAGPLDQDIALTVAGDLAVLLGTPRVAAGGLAGFDPAWRVEMAIQRFDATPGREVVVEALWTVRASAAGTARAGRSLAREGLEGEGVEAIPPAYSRALATVSADIAAAIRAETRAGR